MTATLALRVERLGYALHHMRRGRKILVVTQLAAQVRPIVHWLDRHKAEGERTYFGAAREALRDPVTGGEVILGSSGMVAGPWHRGLSFDLVLVAGDVPTTARLEEALRLLTLDSDLVYLDLGHPTIVREDQP